MIYQETKASVSVLISQQEIEKRLDEMASDIKKDFAGKDIVMICVLKGGVIFMVDLARKLTDSLSSVAFDFMDISSYGNSTISSGIVKIEKDLSNTITGKNVLLIEDIIDSGRTLSHIVKHLKSKEPTTLKICTLLNKPERRIVHDIVPDYVGFVIPDEFVVGYGLDYAEQYRNLPFVGVLNLA